MTLEMWLAGLVGCCIGVSVTAGSFYLHLKYQYKKAQK